MLNSHDIALARAPSSAGSWMIGFACRGARLLSGGGVVCVARFAKVKKQIKIAQLCACTCACNGCASDFLPAAHRPPLASLLVSFFFVSFLTMNVGTRCFRHWFVSLLVGWFAWPPQTLSTFMAPLLRAAPFSLNLSVSSPA